MKKLILFLFISLSFCLEAQIQMSQVNGLIPKLKSKQDTIHFPSVRTGDTFLNDLGLFSAPPSTGGSASGTPLYFLPTNSPTSGFLELGYAPYSSTVEIPYSIPVGTTHLSSHLYDLGIATTNIDAGNWFISSRSKVNNLSGSVKLHVDFFLYHTDGTKTILFGGDSEIFSTTEFKVYSGQLPEASFTCVATDRIGVDIYAVNSGGATKTLTTSLGAGIATFFSTPLRERHSSLRDKNGESAFQHVTTDQISNWNSKQPSLYGVGFIKANGSTISFDPQTYLTIEALSPYITTNQANAAYEYKFAQGYPNQYLRGDKTWQLFPTVLSSFTNDLGNYGGWITGINSGMVTTALGYTPEQQLNFSTGLTRTGNTITNNITQYTDALARSAQTNSSITTALGYTPWYSGNHPTTVGGYGITDYNTASQFNSTALTGTAPFTVNSTTMVNNLKAQYLGANIIVADANLQKTAGFYYYNTGSTNVPFIGRLLHQSYNEAGYNGQIMTSEIGNRMAFRTQTDATWNPWNEVYHSGNLTNNLSTNYLSKWNGSSFANSLINDDGNRIYINSTVSSTSPTTGALVVGGGIGVGGVSHFGDDIVASSTIQASEFVKSGGTANQFLKANGSVDSNTYATGTGTANGTNTGDNAANSNYANDYRSSNFVAGTNYQAPITLTTNGTSGAATKVGDVINIPNYNLLGYDTGHSYSTTNTGYQKFSTGLIIQWVYMSYTGTFTFPIQFPNGIISISASSSINPTFTNSSITINDFNYGVGTKPDHIYVTVFGY